VVILEVGFSDIVATEELESNVRDCARRAADEIGTIGDREWSRLTWLIVST
jgi:hypothetical protein